MSGELPLYYFIPAVREGLAAYISGSPDVGERAVVEATLTPVIDDTPDPDKSAHMRVGLYGPGDVVGFAPSVVARTDPHRSGCWDYEPNYMPCIEFSEPDLPWRFTPDVAGNQGLMPWITLIVLDAGEHGELVQQIPDPDKPEALPVRWIHNVTRAALPDLNQAWRWAHVQVTAPSSAKLTKAQLKDRISGVADSTPGHHVARLLCPRRLKARTRYTAFVVPTFKLGQVAAGLPVSLGDTEKADAAGWSDSSPEKIDLPYYFKWEFSTSKGGDFEHLARLLERRPLPMVGMRPMDCSKPPYGLPPVPGDPGLPEVLQLEGALMPTGADPPKWSNETADIRAYRAKLAEVLNLAATRAKAGNGNAGTETPAVVPPIFGRRHSRQQGVDAGDHQSWMNDLNLDPRQRAAAGLGAHVVTKQQEALMAGVWEQLGDIEIANQALAFGQVGLAASTSLFTRLKRLSVPDLFWTIAPLAARLRIQTAAGPTSLARLLAGSPIPMAAFDPAFRRILRRGGGIRKRQGNSRTPPPSGRDILSRLNAREIAAAGPPPAPEGMPTLCEITDAAIKELEKEAGHQARAEQGRFRVNGRVIDETGRALVGATVEAWDWDPFLTDKLGDARTDGRGEFRIEFDDKYFHERFLDRRPDLSFKVRRHGRDFTVISPRVLRGVQAGNTPVQLQVRDAGISAAAAFRIKGRVVYSTTRVGVPRVIVEVWDRDRFRDDLIASVLTSGNGAFDVAFDKRHFGEHGLDSRPDVYFRVRKGDEFLNSYAAEIKDLPPAQSALPEIVIKVDPPSKPATPPSGPRVDDFCEAAITPELIAKEVAKAVAAGGAAQLHREAAELISNAITEWLAPQSAPTETLPAAPLELGKLRDTILAAIDPSKTIRARIESRLQRGPGIVQYGLDGLGRIESRIDFPQAMYAPLAEISQDLILPGVESVPQNTIVFLRTNRRFMEAYMVGLNDALASEVLWRGAPVYPWSTFFRQFWDVSGLPAHGAEPDSLRDIARLSMWPPDSPLGQHRANGGVPEQSVLLLRGDLLKRYPDTLIYAVPAIGNKPALAEFGSTGASARTWPIFSGSLPPDLTFLGFPITPDELRSGGPANEGYYLVIEERPGQPRFGFNERAPGAAAPNLPDARWWFDLEWEHFDIGPGEYVDGTNPDVARSKREAWETSSAAIANFCLRRPVRIALHAGKLLSDTQSS